MRIKKQKFYTIPKLSIMHAWKHWAGRDVGGLWSIASCISASEGPSWALHCATTWASIAFRSSSDIGWNKIEIQLCRELIFESNNLETFPFFWEFHSNKIERRIKINIIVQIIEFSEIDADLYKLFDSYVGWKRNLSNFIKCFERY